MSKHTPGPWKISSKDLGPNGREFFILDKNGNGICGGPWCMSYEDARLIAVAPELLELLKIVLELWQRESDFPVERSNEFKMAQKLIAKAEGE